MDPEKFKKELAEFGVMADDFKAALANVDKGSTDEEIAATKPRSSEVIAEATTRHEKAAEESALAEARAYMDSAKMIIDTLKVAAG